MQGRTDLALEQKENLQALPDGIAYEEIKKGDAVITKITVKDKTGSAALKKPIGKYITIEVPPFTDNINNEKLVTLCADILKELIPSIGSALIVGLGNREITPDALGPEVMTKILATAHVGNELKRVAGLEKIREVFVLSPGVLGQTGIEVFDLLSAVSNKIKPAFVVVVDALASRNLCRLGCTLQMSDTGIEPGAGVGNARSEISQKTLGIPVIAMGVPTVVDAQTLAYELVGREDENISPDGRQMIVTPREIDLLIDRSADLISAAINRALHPDISPDIISELLS